jgi:hypothetical protein
MGLAGSLAGKPTVATASNARAEWLQVAAASAVRREGTTESSGGNVKRLICALLAAAFAQGATAVTVYTSDFIDDSSRSGFNGFESIPNDGEPPLFFAGSYPYVEQGIAVEQIDVDPEDINVDCPFCFVDSSGADATDGERSWYPLGPGERGYTTIRRSDGLDFFDIGFLTGSGFEPAPTRVYYKLFNNGSLVLEGSVAKDRGNALSYLGFGGGGFDEVRVFERLRDASETQGANGLAVDSIEMRGSGGTVPEPGTLALLGFALAGWATARNKRR